MNTNFVQGGHNVWGNRSLNRLRYGLGILWLVDALLQLQPGMFHPAFYGNLSNKVMPSVLQDLRLQSPHWIAWAVAVAQWLFIRWPIEVNLFIVAVQLLLGGFLLLKLPARYRRIGAVGSIIWGLVIWVFGEALGGLGAWGMTFYDGFPGSALLYAFAGLILLIQLTRTGSAPSVKWIQRSMYIFFFVCFILQILPANGMWDRAGQMDVFANSAFQIQITALSTPIMQYTMWLSDHPVTNNILLAMFLLVASMAVWRWQSSSVGRWFVYVWLFFSWWFGMDFGYLFSGLSTDPNVVPILFCILFALAPVNAATKSSEEGDSTLV